MQRDISAEEINLIPITHPEFYKLMKIIAAQPEEKRDLFISVATSAIEEITKGR